MPRKCACLLIYQFCVLCVSDDLLPFKVKSLGHLEWPVVKYFFAYLSLYQSRNWRPIILKLGAWCKVIGAYNFYISDFFELWPKVRSILWHPHYKAMGGTANSSFMHQDQLFYHELSYVRVLLMIQLQILVGDLDRGHLGSYHVIRSHQQVLAKNSRLKRATGMGVV